MNDNCSCVYVDTEGTAEFIVEKILTARKQHVCGECGEAILPGKQYERVTAKWERLDEGVETYKTCMPCFRFRRDYFCQSFYYGMIWEDAAECFREASWDGEDYDEDYLAMLPKKFR